MSTIFEKILNKIKLLSCRGTVTEIKNTDAFQKVQAIYLPDESISDIERLQEYGFESFPPIENTECYTVFFNGNRDANRGKVIKVYNKLYRPDDLEQGDVCMYAKDSAKQNANRITIKSKDGEIWIETFAGDKIEIKNTGEINITASSYVNVNGNTKKFVTYSELNSAITLFLTALMSHVHTSAASGNPTSVPTSPITFDISAAESQKARTG